MAEKRESNKRSIGSLVVDIDCSEALKGLKAVTREAKKAAAALKEVEDIKRVNKLLIIELDSEESTPRVFFEGEEINAKVRVSFNWETKTHEPGKISFNIEHYEMNEIGEPIIKGIGLLND
ncbi:hypothetical protein LIS82_08870 [Cytobacillus solani]|uniref:hypothetical protein n=1 Tax=Cytobacillus solani TaxID=1637975 RepID=UPI0020797A8F|nr:hypothetical protein [Cytobacillus solani]USK56564.1 hypothetical protein LIS82_08870 [Cytobacillus solani]